MALSTLSLLRGPLSSLTPEPLTALAAAGGRKGTDKRTHQSRQFGGVSLPIGSSTEGPPPAGGPRSWHSAGVTVVLSLAVLRCDPGEQTSALAVPTGDVLMIGSCCELRRGPGEWCPHRSDILRSHQRAAEPRSHSISPQPASAQQPPQLQPCRVTPLRCDHLLLGPGSVHRAKDKLNTSEPFNRRRASKPDERENYLDVVPLG